MYTNNNLSKTMTTYNPFSTCTDGTYDPIICTTNKTTYNNNTIIIYSNTNTTYKIQKTYNNNFTYNLNNNNTDYLVPICTTRTLQYKNNQLIICNTNKLT